VFRAHAQYRMKLSFGVLVVFLMATFAILPARADTITVDNTCGLADAIAAANTDTATGECPAGDGADIIVLTADITLDAELPPITSEITLEGDGHAISGDDRFRIFFVRESGDLTIEETMLRDGIAKPDARRCRRFRGRSDLDAAGGAICNWGLLSVTDSYFSGNTGPHSGGAIWSGGQLSVTDCEFIGNVSRGNRVGYGGAIYSSGTLAVSDCDFSENWSSVRGGAIFGVGALSIADSEFRDNRSLGIGGAIYGVGATRVMESEFSGNSVEEIGGAIYGEGDLHMTDSEFSDNSAGRYGGAIVAKGAVTFVRDSFFSDNSPDDCWLLECVGVTGGVSKGQEVNRSAQVSAQAGAIYVDGSCSLADAITAANRDQAYGGCRAGSGADMIVLTDGILLQAELPPITSEITLRGDGNAISGNRFRIFYVGESGVLTIRNTGLGYGGAQKGARPCEETEVSWRSRFVGGAICNRGHLEVVESEFRSNTSRDLGGAIYNRGDLILSRTTFRQNTANAGGAIYNDGSVSVMHNRFMENSAIRQRGGAIDSSGVLSIAVSEFSDNSAEDYGGAIKSSGVLNIRHSAFLRNKSARRGGAIDSFGALAVEDSDFNKNSSNEGGAIFNSGNLSLERNAFSGNSTRFHGGAIYHAAGYAQEEDSSFSNNRPHDCYGMDCAGSPSGG